MQSHALSLTEQTKTWKFLELWVDPVLFPPKILMLNPVTQFWEDLGEEPILFVRISWANIVQLSIELSLMSFVSLFARLEERLRRIEMFHDVL